MKKKVIIISFAIFMTITIGVVTYKIFGTINVKNKTNEFLETKGYYANDVSNINIKHSFFNGFLSYDEWSISVQFVSEPNVFYSFAYKNKKIIFRGVNDSKKDKEELKELEDKFNDGKLTNN